MSKSVRPCIRCGGLSGCYDNNHKRKEVMSSKALKKRKVRKTK